MHEAETRRTPLYSIHTRLGAKMAPFAGFSMPIQYSGIRAEHEAVRKHAGLFDVSHMGNFFLIGSNSLELLQKLTTNNAAKLHVGEAQYSSLCLPEGGVVDDIVVYCVGAESYMVVVNAGNLAKDWAWFNAHRGAGNLDLRDGSDETAILSLQGPEAEAVLRKLTPEPIADLASYCCITTRIAGIECLVARTGYTGEDGFELFPSSQKAAALWEALSDAGSSMGLLPIGLGARDTLRLEAGYSLYGHELSEAINPLESGLGWIVDFEKGDFIGRDSLLRIKSEGLSRKMTGLLMDELAIPRGGCLVSQGGKPVGVVTSGTLSPTLGKGIALALVDTDFAVRGTVLGVEIRETVKPCKAVGRAFYKRSKPVAA